MNLLVIDNYDSFTFNLVHLIEKLGNIKINSKILIWFRLINISILKIKLNQYSEIMMWFLEKYMLYGVECAPTRRSSSPPQAPLSGWQDQPTRFPSNFALHQSWRGCWVALTTGRNRFGRCKACPACPISWPDTLTCVRLCTRLLNYGDCEDPAKMTDTKMDLVSRHQAPSLRMRM